MGKKDGPKRSARAAPKGDPTTRTRRAADGEGLRRLKWGVSTVFGHNGLGGELAARPATCSAPHRVTPRAWAGLGCGARAQGVAVWVTPLESAGSTPGRGGGTGGYGSNAGVLGNKKSVDIGITSSEPMVVGSLDKELIRKVIHANRGQVRFCYESQLNRFPKLEGKVAIKFIISPEGTVKQSSVAQTTVDNAELEACVAGRVRTWIFPKPRGGGMVMVTYPFIFKQSGQ
jgi:TonB family protein